MKKNILILFSFLLLISCDNGVNYVFQNDGKSHLNDSGEMIVNNASDIEALFRYPDQTNHTVFLPKAIQ